MWRSSLPATHRLSKPKQICQPLSCVVRPLSGSPELAASFDGRLASLAWPEGGEYAIFAAQPDGSWAQVARGAGVAVAWAAAAPVFAVLHLPKAAPALSWHRSLQGPCSCKAIVAKRVTALSAAR